MSYDLFFRSPQGVIDPGAFESYFSGRLNYSVDLPQAWYQNEETGVYVVFELRQPSDADDSERQCAASLNINYFRPSYFILEAEPEVTAFVKHFGLLVSDPQVDGMGDGEYNPGLLIRGWDHGNAFGYKAVLTDPTNRPDIAHLPSDVLKKSWSWNFQRRALQGKLGDSVFVPKIIYLTVNGEPATAVAWPDGIPIAVPAVDYFIVGRKELAPRKFLRRLEDHTFVVSAEVLPILERHRARDLPDFVLEYDRPPTDVVEFVRGLPKVQPEVHGVAPDSMLDRELVQGAL
jgi:hypothetical protein